MTCARYSTSVDPPCSARCSSAVSSCRRVYLCAACRRSCCVPAALWRVHPFCGVHVAGTWQGSVEYGYLLNRIWLDDYTIWLQQQPARRIARLAAAVGALSLSKDGVGWPLLAYEQCARDDVDDDDDEHDADA